MSSYYDDPTYIQAEVKRVEAATQQYLIENIVNLINNGFTRESAIQAVVSDDLTKLVTENYGKPNLINTNPDVLIP